MVINTGVMVHKGLNITDQQASENDCFMTGDTHREPMSLNRGPVAFRRPHALRGGDDW